MAEEKKYILYEYLSYFWKRKWLFAIIPLVTAVLVAAAVYIVKSDSRGYTAEGKVFVGSVNQTELTDPDIVEAKYQDVKDLDIFVSEKGKMKFTVEAKSKSGAERALDQVRKQYFADLEKNANTRIDLTTQYLASLDDRLDSLNASLASYKEKIKNPELQYDELKAYTDLIRDSEDVRTRTAERANKMRGDLELFSQPQILPYEVHKAKSYIPESIAIGIILGLILTVALLALMKYLSDARRYYKERGSFLD